MPERWQTDYVVLAGGLRMNATTEFPGVRDMGIGGVAVGMHPANSPVGLEVGWRHARGEQDFSGATFAAELAELSLGARSRFGIGDSDFAFVPSLGWSLLLAEKDFDAMALPDVTQRQDDHGVYGGVGLEWDAGTGPVLGLDYRYVFDEFSDFGGFALDNHQIMLRFGWRF